MYGNENLYKCVASHDLDGRHAHIGKNLKKIISFRINGPMALELGIQVYLDLFDGI